MSARSILEVSGPDRLAFLQGLLTQDVQALHSIQFAALLSPQGKILHDMFLVAQGDMVLLDTPAIHAATLLKRLNMYKLRAKVNIRDASTEWQVSEDSEGLPDPRHAELPRRMYAAKIPLPPQGGGREGGGACSDLAIHRTASDAPTLTLPLRGREFTLGIPDSAIDFAPDSITALDAGYDLLNAVSFTKGCYVGQEVTARMHYKNIARKGFFLIQGQQPLTAGSPLFIGDAPAGTLSSATGNTALCFLKFDAALSDLPATVDGHPVTRVAPSWMQKKIEQFQSQT